MGHILIYALRIILCVCVSVCVQICLVTSSINLLNNLQPPLRLVSLRKYNRILVGIFLFYRFSFSLGRGKGKIMEEPQVNLFPIYVVIEIMAILFIVYVVKCDTCRQGPR